MNKLAIIIPTFNRKSILKHLLECLSTQTTKEFDVIVVIDGSTDGTEIMIKENHPETHIVKGNGDWWWTKSINEGLKYAQEKGFTTFLLMNDDTYIESTFLEKLYGAYSNVGGVLGAISVNHKEPHEIFYSGIQHKNWLTCKHYKYHYKPTNYDSNKINGIHPVKFLPGRGMLFGKEVLDSIGLFNESDFPQYLADFDFSHSAFLKGFPVNISWDTPVFSYLEMTAKGNINEKSFKSLIKSFFNDKSPQSIKRNIYYYKKHARKTLVLSLACHYGRVILAFFKK